MPAVFIGHGNPMNALEKNVFSDTWRILGETIPRPSAVISISAHWVTAGTHVTTAKKPETIHDFYGFPDELSEFSYPAPGSPELAEQIIARLKSVNAKADLKWGLDHGTWSVLARMYPKADIPVVQISLDHSKTPEWHFNTASLLRQFRNENILIVGSGNIVHNLRTAEWKDVAFDWAVDFDTSIKDAIRRNDFESVTGYKKYGEPAAQSVPTDEHFLPLLYILGLKENDDQVSFFCEKVTMGSLSMTGVMIGSE